MHKRATILLSLLVGTGTCVAEEVPSKFDRVWGVMQAWSLAKYNFAYFDQVPALAPE